MKNSNRNIYMTGFRGWWRVLLFLHAAAHHVSASLASPSASSLSTSLSTAPPSMPIVHSSRPSSSQLNSLGRYPHISSLAFVPIATTARTTHSQVLRHKTPCEIILECNQKRWNVLQKLQLDKQSSSGTNSRQSFPVFASSATLDNIDEDGTILSSTAQTFHPTRSASAEITIEEAREILQPHFSFPLDQWQLAAGASLLSSHNIIVCAPTGSGKTVIGEMALRIALTKGTKAIYTTPLKALSNQKFGEMRKIFGVENVGLATGDVSVRRGANVTIMTTEVYRNMAWRARSSEKMMQLEQLEQSVGEDGLDVNYDLLESSSARSSRERDEYADLTSNSIVVLDEFHYMGQKGRGSTWEECIITNPPHTQIVGLSATLPNAHRLASWIESVTGRKTVYVEAGGSRPVPLRYYFCTKRDFSPLFRDEEAGPGAPHGLLGLRGDGLDVSKLNLKKKKNAGLSGLQGFNDNGLPKGLDLHPILQSVAERRLASIERRVKRMMQQDSYDAFDRYDRYGRNNKYSNGPTMSVKEQKRAKENMLKAELRKSVPSVATLLRRLQQDDLLPAIFFIFSRAGCDNAAQVLCDGLKTDAEERKNKKNFKLKERKEEKGKGRGRGRGRGRRNSSETDLSEENLAMVQDLDGRTFRAELLDQLLSDEYDSSANREPLIGVDDESFLSEQNLQQYADIGLLNLEQTKEVAYRVFTFNEENPEIAFSDDAVERLLCGIGSHHAGVLPAHKAFIETLFRLELMKVVFATETLAAGINMPARTTVICSMAKRGDSSGMELLETSNMLQMAGRAGRRGMDVEGACVIAATAFEGPEDAITILTNEIKPVESQFAPSYALAINLIERGFGKLDVARNMVQKSFAVWEIQQREKELQLALDGLEADEETASPEEQFLNVLQMSLEKELVDGNSSTGASRSKISQLVDVLSDGKKLKKISKKYSGAAQILDLEQSTLQYLERELEEMDPVLDGLLDDDHLDLMGEIKTQYNRVAKGEREVNGSIIAALAKVANRRMKDDVPESEILRKSLEAARHANADDFPFPEGAPLEPGELNYYVTKAPKQSRRLMLSSTSSVSDDKEDECWNQMLALTNVLEAFGCLKPLGEEMEQELDPGTCEYEVTPGGDHVGSLGTDNALWQVCALGGAWDVAYESSELDEFQEAFAEFEYDNNVDAEEDKKFHDSSSNVGAAKPQREADHLTELLCDLSPSEMAGYVSSLVVDAPRNSASVVMAFQKLTKSQQRVVQGALISLERLVEVQRKYSVDDSIGKCQLELGACDVVTEWASGSSWNEVLELSGAAPGDLVRTLSRALDALRQLGNLPYTPARRTDDLSVRLESSGIHPKIRELCREAVIEMDRYPVKDILPFEADDESADDQEYEEDEKENKGEVEDEDEDEDEDEVHSLEIEGQS